MSKELADRLEQWLKWTILNRQEKQLLNEAIAALRAEPVAWAVTNRGYYVAGNIFRYKADAQMCMDNLNRMHPQEARTMVPLYAAPARETANSTKCPTCKADHWVGCYLDGCPIRPDNADQSKPVAFARRVHCQNGGDVCLAGNWDGVCCPEDSCDIDDGTRKKPADTLKPEAEPALSAEQIEEIRKQWDGDMYPCNAEFYALCDMALSSLTARDDGIETSKILQDVANERARQDSKWGGASNDDNWSAFDWHEMIADYNAWARRMAAMGSMDKARNRYVQIAALAVAAVEAIDRKGASHG